jgi:hypothetical protein
MTAHHYLKVSQSRKCQENVKNFECAVAKTIRGYDETGSHEDRHKNGRPRVTSAA